MIIYSLRYPQTLLEHCMRVIDSKRKHYDLRPTPVEIETFIEFGIFTEFEIEHMFHYFLSNSPCFKTQRLYKLISTPFCDIFFAGVFRFAVKSPITEATIHGGPITLKMIIKHLDLCDLLGCNSDGNTSTKYWLIRERENILILEYSK